MKKHTILVMGISISVLVVLSGCDVSEWNQNRTEEYQGEKVEMSAVDKEMIIDAYVQGRDPGGVVGEDDLKKVLLDFDERGIFDDMTAPGSLQEKTYEERIALVGDFVDQMMRDIERKKVVERTGVLTDSDVPIVDLETGVKKYFHDESGSERYTKYLAQRFNIGIYPTYEEIEGEWSGKYTISNVVVFKEMVGAPDIDPDTLYALGGNTYEFDFIIDINEEALEKEKTEDESEPLLKNDDIATDAVKVTVTNGKIIPATATDAGKFPFAYPFVPDFAEKTDSIAINYSDVEDSGHLTARFGDNLKKLEGIINVHAKKTEDGAIKINGEGHFNFLKRYLKTSGSITAIKKDSAS